MTALSIDISVPAMKKLQEVFHATPSAVQPTLGAFLIGYALGQLVCGPISDRKGRRPVLLFGLIIFTLAGFACAWSQTLGQLIFFRFIQGLSGSVGPTLARAIAKNHVKLEREFRGTPRNIAKFDCSSRHYLAGGGYADAAPFAH